jgi:hypothetical protein
MRPEQTIVEMAEEILSRQTRAQVQRTGQSHASARAAVIQTPASCLMEELRSGAHEREEVRYWQANLLFGRAGASRLVIMYKPARLDRLGADFRAGVNFAMTAF